MAKKSKKANKVAETNVAVENVVEEVFGPSPSPAGIDWNVGVSEETKAAYEASKKNGGSKEAEVEKVIETQTEIPVGGFNRNGLDAMLTGHIGPEVVVNVAQKVSKKSSRIKLSGGYRGTVRDMLLADKTGEEIIKTIAAMYMEKEGKSYEYGFGRGKRILGDMELEMKRGIFGKKEDTEEVVNA